MKPNLIDAVEYERFEHEDVDHNILHILRLGNYRRNVEQRNLTVDSTRRLPRME
jgi:hypothetical protein